jgi:uncharacterized YigZ family protein
MMSEIKDKYQSIASTSEGLFKEKGSKFLSFAFPVTNEEDIKIIQKDLRKKYYDARHHVFAWRLGIDEDNFRASDDGEPANSSGMPVLGQIRSYELSDILIVVIRYFGGTKLGIPGLINAYKTAAKEALDNNVIISKTITKTYRISFAYENMNHVMRKLKEFRIEQQNPKFESTCTIDIYIKLSDCEIAEHLFDEYPNIEIKEII